MRLFHDDSHGLLLSPPRGAGAGLLCAGACAAGRGAERGWLHLLPAGLSPLTRCARIEIAFRPAKDVWRGPRSRGRGRSRARGGRSRGGPSRGRGSRPHRLRLSLASGRRLRRRRLSRTAGARSSFATAVLIETRIGGVDVAVDDPVVHRRAGGALVDADVVPVIEAHVVVADVVVVDVAVNGPVAVDVIDVHVAMDDVAVDDDVVIAIVHVDVGDVNARAGAVDPAGPVPAVIVNPVMMPIAVAVEPRADEKAHAKGDGQSPGGPAVIADIGIVNRHVDVLRAHTERC